MERKRKVLVVDDDYRITEYLALVLKAHRYVVRTENDSTRAAGVAESFRPDLVLLDALMPHKDGGEVARELRLRPVTAETPIVFVTAWSGNSDFGTACAGIEGGSVLAKPVGPTALIKLIEQKLAVDHPALAGSRLLSPEMERPSS